MHQRQAQAAFTGVGSGCNGRVHEPKDCSTCKIRQGDLPEAPTGVIRPNDWTGMTIILNSSSMMTFIFAPLLGMGLLCSAAAMLFIMDKVEDLAGVGFLGYFGCWLTFGTLFRKEQILVDHVRRVFVHTKRSLLSDSKETVIELDEIETVVREKYKLRTWLKGKYKSEEVEASVCLERKDGSQYSLGSGNIDHADTIAKVLSKTMNLPLIQNVWSSEAIPKDVWVKQSFI